MSTKVATEHRSSVWSTRSAEEVWSLVGDPSRWPEWNAAVSALDLDGPFAKGTTGTLITNDGNRLPFQLLDVQSGRGYTSETTIATTVSLLSSTSVAPHPDGGVLVAQHSRLTGPAAVHFAPAFGDALVRGVEASVARLAGSRP